VKHSWIRSIRGMLFKIFGYEEPVVLFPLLVFYEGDNPSQHEVAPVKCGSNVRLSCIRYMYNSREGTI